MAYDALSSEQQELLDLLRNELADYVDGEPPELWESAQIWQAHFKYLSGQLEHLIRAVQMVGLTGFAASCEYLLQQFEALARSSAAPAVETQQHISSWPVAFLGYLQQVLAKGFTAEAASQLVDYLAFSDWPLPLNDDQRDGLLQTFEGSNVIVDEQAAQLTPDQITSEQASLSIPRDVRPELLDGLIAELPQQAENFSAAIEHYIHTNDGSYLLTAQRVSHTIKGAANVVGITGMANLMHYCEDILETHQKGIDVGGESFADLLLDAADCLANISDSLQGFGPAPDNVQALIVQLLRALQGEVVSVEFEAPQEPPVLDQVHAEVTSDVSHNPAFAGYQERLAKGEPDIEAAIAVDDFSEIDALLSELDSDGLVVIDESAELDSLESLETRRPTDLTGQEAESPTETVLLADSHADSAASTDLLDAQDIVSAEEFDGSDVDAHALFGGDIHASELQIHEPQDCDLVNFDADADAELAAANAVIEDANRSVIDNEASVVHAGAEATIEVDKQEVAAASLANSSTPENEPVTAQSTLPTDAASGMVAKNSLASEDVKPQFNLTIPDEKATDLLRMAGEIQIANTQILARTDTAKEVLKAALRFQAQLVELAEDFEKQLAKESAAKIAASRERDVDMDPLELERYNELHSFASRLQEVVTDAQEAVRDADGTMLDLKAIAEDQRQMGFDMQNQVLGVRMLPAGVMASRFARAVRQASRLIGKPAKFVFEGEDVLVDSRVLHSIADPILHLLRNAVDHGLESSSAERLAKNKVAEGSVRVTFERVGEAIRIQVSDDGCGLNYSRIAQLGFERGLLDAKHDYTPAQLQQVILLPGFSTREQVTQTSGRGIGLDVVNDQVRQLKGQLQIQSDVDTGTQFVMSVPMSVMSAHLLLVRSAGRMVGVISRGLAQIVYLQPGDIEQNAQGGWRYLLGDQELDVLAFDEIAQVAGGCDVDQCAALLVTQKADGSQCGIAVESIRASEEHVIKPLSRWAYRAEGVTGAAILGNGEVVAVVDVHDLPALRYSSQQLEQWLSHHATKNSVLPIAPKPVALVVDDSLSARRAMAQFMADAGYEVVSARDGFDAIKLLESSAPDIALIDLEMPRMNGLELAAHMRSQAELASVPIVMVTSRTTARHKILAENAGVDRYLNKPWSDDELTETLIAMSNKANKSAVGE